MIKKLTPTQLRLWRLLADGQPHPIAEMIQLLPDNLCGEDMVREHISQLRKKMRAAGRKDVIITELIRRRGHYRRMYPLPKRQ